MLNSFLDSFSVIRQRHPEKDYPVNDDRDLLGINDNKYPARRARKQKDLGPLHDLLTRGLPEYVDEGGMLDVKRLAIDLSVSYQSVYHIFTRGSISKKRINQVLELSKRTKPANRPETMVVSGREVLWSPLVLDDFWAFIG